MGQRRIRLITRGDDSGSCDSANRAVVEAFQKGILRNTSLMVPGPAFAAAARLLAPLRDLCVGLHVTLNAEWEAVKWGPVLPADKVPALVDEQGNFTGTPQVLYDRKADVEQMVAEVQAQLDLARKHGMNIRYMDEHMGVGWLPGLRERLARLAEREGLVDAHNFKGLPAAECASTDPFERLVARLAAAPQGTYVFVTHPGYDDEEMRRFSHKGLQPGEVAVQRDIDRRFFLDPRIVSACREYGVEPIRYTDAAK